MKLSASMVPPEYRVPQSAALSEVWLVDITALLTMPVLTRVAERHSGAPLRQSVPVWSEAQSLAEPGLGLVLSLAQH